MKLKNKEAKTLHIIKIKNSAPARGLPNIFLAHLQKTKA